MAKLRAALTGAALCALAWTPMNPAAATPAFAAPANPDAHTSGSGGGQSTTLITTDGSPLAPSALSLDPPATRRGGIVDLRTFAACDGSNTGTVTSPALEGPVQLAPAADGGLLAETRVGKDVKPGSYRVVDLCGGKVVAVGSLAIVDMGALATGGGWGATRIADGGSSAALLGGVRSTGSLALTGTAAAGGLVLLRRRLRGGVRG
jgi:hypothetical protein